jgi:hypothetical protein
MSSDYNQKVAGVATSPYLSYISRPTFSDDSKKIVLNGVNPLHPLHPLPKPGRVDTEKVGVML